MGTADTRYTDEPAEITSCKYSGVDFSDLRVHRIRRVILLLGSRGAAECDALGWRWVGERMCSFIVCLVVGAGVG